MEFESKRSIMILGCTGSVGTTALKALEAYQDQFEIVGLSAHNNVRQAAEIAQRWGSKHVAITGMFAEPNIQNLFPSNTTLHLGKEGLNQMLLSIEADMVLNAISGAAGLEPTFVAIESGKDIALSNKESVVMAGELLFAHAKAHNCRIIPVDSEHSTLYALLQAFGKEAVARLVITASGGPFRELSLSQLDNISVDMALEHPTWKMGPKISVDSATMANKGLEVMEASFLFGFDAHHIEVVIHPQSVVHSLIRMSNGALYAQLSPPDIALPVMAALSEQLLPLESVVRPLDFNNLTLTFFDPDPHRFPLLTQAYYCTHTKHSYPIAYNAANEVAVQAFFDGKLKFNQISSVVASTLEFDWLRSFSTLEEIQEIDKEVRKQAHILVKGSR